MFHIRVSVDEAQMKHMFYIRVSLDEAHNETHVSYMGIYNETCFIKEYLWMKHITNRTFTYGYL